LHNAQDLEQRSYRMARRRKKKKKKFSAAKTVKSIARDLIGPPPPTQRIPTLKESRRETKHKPTLGKLLSEE
jgi:hypothetical protein